MPTNNGAKRELNPEDKEVVHELRPWKEQELQDFVKWSPLVRQSAASETED